jgi:hypothetical protein
MDALNDMNRSLPVKRDATGNSARGVGHALANVRFGRRTLRVRGQDVPRGARLTGGARLFTHLPPGIQGYRAADQGGSFPRIQLAVEAKPHVPAAMPPDYRRPAERAAVQYHRRSNRQACRTIELRTGGRQVEELDRMTLSVCLKKGRQRHRHARIDAAVLIRRTVLRRCGVCHVV